MNAPTLLLVGAYIVCFGSIYACHRISRAITAQVREQASDTVELIGLMRPLLEDLHSRDPQIAEATEVALLELDRWERKSRLVASGKHVSALVEARRQRKDGAPE